jgi:5-methylcytosine-specific restriction endonuclease McrA
VKICCTCKEQKDIKSGSNLHFDHKMPLFRGGQDCINNLVPSRKDGNLKKRTKTSEEFITNRELKCL